MKNRKKTLKWIIGIVILLSVAFLVLPQLLIKNWEDLSEGFSNRMLILYYSFTILGAIGTCAAVIIALFSEEIKMWLYKPNISIQFKEDAGFSEIIDENDSIPIAESYRCFLQFEDQGFVNVADCSLKVVDIKHGKNKEKVKTIKTWAGTKRVNPYPFEISVDYPYELKILSINNPNLYGTPTDNPHTPLISIYGLYLDDRYREKGYWEIHYCLVSRNGNSIKFKISVDWDGEFSSRKTEMKDHLKISKL